MFHTASTSVRTILVAAGAAGFVALGAGVAGADTLGGVTDGLPLGDLGHQVPTALTEGVGTPVGDLVKVEPGQISAQPELQRQSAASTDTVGHVIGDGVSAEAPVETGTDNATNVGPLDLGEATQDLPLNGASETLPLNGGAVDPVSGLLDGIGLLDALSSGGAQTLPLGHAEPTSGLEPHTAIVEDTVRELGGRVQTGVQQSRPDLVHLDEVDLAPLGGTVPMSDPVGLDTGENTDLTGGLTTLLPADVNETLPMTAGTDLSDLALLPQTPGGDLIDVQGLPHLGAPEFGVDRPSITDGSSLTEGTDLGLDLPVGLV